MALMKPHSPKSGAGRQPEPLEWMIRIYCLQQEYGRSDPGMEDALYDIESMRRFVKLNLASDAIPDEKKLNMKRGTIVDATLIAAPSSTKNKDNSRDPEMSSTKKGHQWHFGMKAHIGVDTESGFGP